MNKNQYIEILEKKLSKLPHDERLDFINEIQVHFNESSKQGKTDTQIVESLGSAKHLARNILLEYDIDQLAKEKKILGYGTIGLKILLIGFKNLLVFPLAIGIFATVLALYVSLFAFYLSGALLIASPLIHMIAPSLVSTGPLPLWSMSLIGMGLILLTKKGHDYMNVGSTKLFRLFLKSLKHDNMVISS